jgi:hypothetical protein
MASPRPGSRRCSARWARGSAPTRSRRILFFDSEDDYRRGDEFLSAMPADETPGQRTAVTKYDVAVRTST